MTATATTFIEHEVQQGTPEWLSARLGIVTASEIDALVTPEFKVRAGEGVTTYLNKKIAERWLRQPLASFNGGAMEQGSLKEEEAIPWLEFLEEKPIRRVGFITTEDKRLGCSPDGMYVGEDMGVECKCPLTHTHVGYLMAGTLPKEYAAQVQCSMLVTGFFVWRFLSYARNLPPLLLTVERDERAMGAMRQALADFNARLDAGYARLLEINGGPLVRPEEPILF